MVKNNNNNNNKGDNGGEKTASVTVVLKIDMHCEGCASRIVKCARSLQGVETVKSESASGKLTVTGDLDPAKLREKLAEKTKKKVELISPQPKKEKESNNNNNNNNKDKNKSDQDKNKENKSDEKKQKPKEVPVTTAILKLNFHCQGCIGKIQKTVTKTKGVNGITMDKEKQLVTVKGTMDVKKLVECLSEKLKRPVEIVPPAKKDKEKSDESGDKKKGGGGGDGGGGKDNNKGGGEGVNMMEYMAAQPAYGYGYYPGGPYGYPVQAHAPQIFSDENPNACVVM